VTREISLNINGRRHVVSTEPRRVLADVIRDECGLTGTHVGCAHGVCGACTIIVDGEAIRSCLMFAVQADGSDIRTVEGLNAGRAYSPLQAAFEECHAVQCGFCTPGFLMLATEMLERDPDVDEENVREVLASNLCRCTGYENIIKAVMLAAERMKAVA
jgi:carbon-monoxide dehydrogenase small subunit